MLGPDDLRKQRRALGLTQARLAELLGVAPNTVARWERGDKRIGHPERVWHALEEVRQRATDASPSTFAPSTGTLPADLSSFVGREVEIAEVRRLLAANRLVTLTGAGGIGKTRLALRVAQVEQPRYSDGVWLVELSSLVDPTLVPQAVATALRVREQPGHSLAQAIVRFLETKDLLLVLDNCEHLLHACEQLIGDLLTGTRTMRLLATSREPLVIQRGVVWRVPSMSLPAVNYTGEAQLASELMESEAVRLFVERAGVSQVFSLTESNAAAVAQICLRLDGIPLALELAAAWASVLTAQQIAARLDHPFWLLANRGTTASPRHQTLRATIDWSYQLLGQRERRMLDRLAVFAGDWSLEAAERICAGDGIDLDDVLGLVGRLVDTSLVIADLDGTEARYRLLETIHHYAEERLQGSGDRDLRHRFAAYFLDLAERYAPDLYAGRSGGRVDALEGITREHDNIRAVLRWSIQTGEIGIGLRLANAVGQFWLSRAHLSEGRAWLAELLARVSGQSSMAPLTAAHLASIGLAARLATAQGEYQAARLLLQDRLARARGVDDRRAVVDSLMLLGVVVEATGDQTLAAQYYGHALRLARALADVRVLLNALEYYGLIAQRSGRFAVARATFEEAVALARQQTTDGLPGRPLAALGYLLLESGDLAAAEVAFRDRLSLWQRLRNERNCAISMSSFGTLALARGDVARAHRHYVDAFQRYRQSGELEALPYFLTCFAVLAAAQQRTESAARIGGAADALREKVGVISLPATLAWTERTLDKLRSTSSAVTWTAGASLSLEQAIAAALAVPASAPTPAEGVRMTPREQEVVKLITQGLTNRAIGAQLVVSERTVDAHIEHIRVKLGLRSRAHLAAWAGSHGLFDQPTMNGPR